MRLTHEQVEEEVHQAPSAVEEEKRGIQHIKPQAYTGGEKNLFALSRHEIVTYEDL